MKWPWETRHEALEERLAVTEREVREVEARVQRIEALTRIVKGTARLRGIELEGESPGG